MNRSTSDPMTTLTNVGEMARSAADRMAVVTPQVKADALLRAAAELENRAEEIINANTADTDEAVDSGVSGALLDRLILNESRVAAMAVGLRDVAALPDPVGETIDAWTRPNGLEIRKVRVPLGVVAVIYEARPNVTSDVAALCAKSGNAAILRGSTNALRSNIAIVDALTSAFNAAGLPEDCLQLVRDQHRETATALMRLHQYVDLLVPRGGAQLIHEVREHATVPYVMDGEGNCHIYVDEGADLDKALRIVVNAKVSKPSVCNATEKLLVHRKIAAQFLAKLAPELIGRGVEMRGDAEALSLVSQMKPATELDWATEYLDLILAVRVVASVETAVEHIRTYSSGHTEAIVTDDLVAAQQFVSACPSAVVMVNASTRFTDGGAFGFGAEIGNSTQRLHARGPMGIRELTTYRWEVWGNGQIRE